MKIDDRSTVGCEPRSASRFMPEVSHLGRRLLEVDDGELPWQTAL
jgi:hypothetical protein